ncbi:hypothetical protein [Terasakiella sp.]|uniref:hypothetical protein n=1 Tax=Terasakiella sp. TaxID=2034861 RepID=UPI003AA884DE
MKIKSILLTDLNVNRANDRHAELANEQAAIQWLLTHRGDHMRNLAKDIVNEGGIYEPPLVHFEDTDKVYVVYDGNRRVTCLKLLHDPEMASTEDWRKFFRDQKKEWNGKFPSKIECQVEENKDRIDEILYRRHIGSQSGIGQSQWDAEAKSNFVKRTGKKSKVNVAEIIDQKLKEAGYLDEGERLPRSNLNRLLSSELFRNRVGLSVKNNHVELTHTAETVMETLSRIAQDLIGKVITLDDIWDNDAKKKYLNSLGKEAALPTDEDVLSDPVNFKTMKPIKTAIGGKPGPKPKPGGKPSPKPKQRKHLIRPEIDYGVLPQVHTQRAVDVWNELQHHLEFGKHDNAISVLFRVLLEFSIENYNERQTVPNVQAGDKLAKKFRKAADHMLTSKIIDKKYHEALIKFEKTEVVLSTNTMHKYVHSKNFFPSDTHLKSMWDTLSDFIVQCLAV